MTDPDVSRTTNLDIIDLKFTDFGTYTCVASLKEANINVNIDIKHIHSSTGKKHILWFKRCFTLKTFFFLCWIYKIVFSQAKIFKKFPEAKILTFQMPNKYHVKRLLIFWLDLDLHEVLFRFTWGFTEIMQIKLIVWAIIDTDFWIDGTRF